MSAEDDDSGSAWYWGAIINVAGCIAINLGTNVMKLGHNKRAQLDLAEDKKPSVAKFREWQIGVFLFAAGNIANFISFGFAAQSLLAALGSIQFVTNVIFASLVLKEKITLFVLVATALIIAGCIMLVIFGDHSSAVYTGNELLALYHQPVYIVYLTLGGVSVVVCYALYLRGKRVTERGGTFWSGWTQLLPIFYSLFSALIGTQSVLFSKSLSVLIRATADGDNQLGNWYTWVTLVCFLISAGFWMTRLNKGLRMFSAMVIVPLLQICWTLFSILEGLLYFEEYKGFTPLKAGMFAVGVAVIFVGVYLLTKSGPKPVHETHAKAEVAMQQEITTDAFEAGRDQDQETLLKKDGVGSSSSPVLPGSPRRGPRDFGLDASPSLTRRVKNLSLRVKSDFGIDLDADTIRSTIGLGRAPGGVVTTIWDPHALKGAEPVPLGSPRANDGGGGRWTERVQLSELVGDMETGHQYHMHTLETIREAPTPAPSSPDPYKLSTQASFATPAPSPAGPANGGAATASMTAAATPSPQQSAFSTALSGAGTSAPGGVRAGSLGSAGGGGSPVGPSRGSSSPVRGAGAGFGAGGGGSSRAASLDAIKNKLISTVEQKYNRARVKVDEAVASASTRLGLGAGDEQRGLGYQTLDNEEGGFAAAGSGGDGGPGSALQHAASMERPLYTQSQRSEGGQEGRYQ